MLELPIFRVSRKNRIFTPGKNPKCGLLTSCAHAQGLHFHDLVTTTFPECRRRFPDFSQKVGSTKKSQVEENFGADLDTTWRKKLSKLSKTCISKCARGSRVKSIEFPGFFTSRKIMRSHFLYTPCTRSETHFSGLLTTSRHPILPRVTKVFPKM